MVKDGVPDLEPINQRIGGIAQLIFDYDFPITAPEDLVVYIDGTRQILATDYTVQGMGKAAGGTITFSATPGIGKFVTIYRDIPIARTTNAQRRAPWRPEHINAEFNRVVLMMQQLERNIGRGLRWPINENVPSGALELSPLENWIGRYVFIGSAGAPEPATAITGTALSRSVIGEFLYPLSDSERAGELTLADITQHWPYGDLRRYKADPTGAAASDIAFVRARLSGHKILGGSRDCIYRITQAIELRDEYQLDGQGCILLVSKDVAAFTNTSGVSVIRGTVENLRIRFNVAATAACLALVDVSRFTFRNIRGDREAGGKHCSYGIRLSGLRSACYWNQFVDIELTACTQGLVRIDGGSNDNFFHDVRLINHISKIETPAGLHITNGSNNRFFGLTLEAIWKNSGHQADCVRLDADANNNAIIGLRTEGHSGSDDACAVFWNGGTDNQIIGHLLLGTRGSTGTLGSNTWLGVSTVSGASSGALGGTQIRMPVSANDPAVDNGALAYNTNTSKLMAFIAGAPAEIAPTTEGSYMATLSGLTTKPTGTIRWVKHGNVVTLSIPDVSGRSDSTDMAFDNKNMPAAIRPARVQRVGGVLMQDDGETSQGTVRVEASGTLRFGSGAAEATFKRSGVKGVFANTITYLLT